MKTIELDQLKYPIGKFLKPNSYTPEIRQAYIATIDAFPEKLRATVETLVNEQLDTPYRNEGWTVRQVVHHCADSHMNAFIRFKLALTEENPTIKPYMEALWAELPSTKMRVEPSLVLLEGLHARWTVLLESLSEKDWKKTFIHPEREKEISLEDNLGIYAWHCDHHLAHITTLKARKEWR